MKNVTITLEEDVARWARIWAAKHNTSVSRFLGSILKERMVKDRGYESAMNNYLARKPIPLKKRGQQYPSRAEVHDR